MQTGPVYRRLLQHFNKPHVTLINDPGGVVSVSETGVVMASGDQHDVEVLIFATGFDSNHIPFPVTGRDGKTLADEFGANEANNFQMTRPKSLWGLHVGNMPNFYMMIGPQSLNPVTNVTLLCEEQAKYIAGLVSSMHSQGHSEVEPTADGNQRLDGTLQGQFRWQGLVTLQQLVHEEH